jgi:hypothetical protein
MLKISPLERYQAVEDVLAALQLEPHWKDLENCMNDVRSRPTSLQTEASDADIASSGYYTPKTLRQANEIREWQARLKARRARQHHRMQLRLTCSSSEVFQ